MNVGNKNFKRPSASSSSSSNEYIYKTTKAVIGDDLNSFLAAGNTLNSSRYAAKLHSQHSLLTSKVTEYDHRTEMKSRHVNRTRPLSSVRNSVNIIYDGQKRFQEAMTYRSFPLHTTRLVACTNSTISFVTIPKYTSSSVIAMGNTTNSSPESMDLGNYPNQISSLLLLAQLHISASSFSHSSFSSSSANQVTAVGRIFIQASNTLRWKKFVRTRNRPKMKSKSVWRRNKLSVQRMASSLVPFWANHQNIKLSVFRCSPNSRD